MNDELADLLTLGQGALAVAGLVFLRVGAALAIAPVFGEYSVPMRVRLALVLGFTLIVTPAVAPEMGEAVNSGGPPARMIAGEVIAGLAIGLLLRLFVLVLQTAGTIAANMTSLSQILGGAGVDPQPAIAHILVMAGLALAVLAGLHVKIALVFVQSYDIAPPGVVLSGAALVRWGTGAVAETFALAFSIAAPFTIAALIYNLALGAINRAMPQLMVAFVGAPAITGGALLLFALTAPVMLSVWAAAFDRVLADPFGTQ